MSSLSQRLHLGVQQKQILTPGLVQMVTVLQLNRMELKDMLINEIAENPVLEEASEPGEELTPQELQSLLECERHSDPADQAILSHVEAGAATNSFDGNENFEALSSEHSDSGAVDTSVAVAAVEESKTETDPFQEIDFGSFFEEYLDPGFKSPASESVEKPSFETFLSSPVTLSDHLQSQLSVMVLPEAVREAAKSIIGNLEESGYLTTVPEEIAFSEGLPLDTVRAALLAVQALEPTGVAAKDLRECLLLQLDARGCRDGVAWKIIHADEPVVQDPGAAARAYPGCCECDQAFGPCPWATVLRCWRSPGRA